ncbi:MAG TPA: GTPase [Alphaproteobacteria bacterium]|jgi:predicted GTPase
MTEDRPLRPTNKHKRVAILGAAGRDFHNFNMLYRDDPAVEVAAFTATQIPGIAGRRYPAALAGPRYPEGIPIFEASTLEDLIRRENIDEVMFAYSDVTHAEVMHQASRALAAGADFVLAGPARTMIAVAKPVIAVSAVRTGSGKSQTARHLARYLRDRGKRVAVLRHPMPYGDLARQAVQRFASRADLEAANCTIEEREEYEPHIDAGGIVFAGVDYRAIAAAAEREADVVLWDGGNNDFPFLKPDLHIVVADALRPDQLATHHPGEAALRMADIVVINKTNAAPPATVERMIGDIRNLVRATIVRAASPAVLDDRKKVEGRRAIVVEDGPTITHGGMAHGAGVAALRGLPGVTLVDPRESAPEALRKVYDAYPHIGRVLPAMGYSPEQRAALRQTIDGSAAEVVISATPIDLAALIGPHKPVVRVRYDYADAGEPRLADLVDAFLARRAG